jgi:hypothetical protein
MWSKRGRREGRQREGLSLISGNGDGKKERMRERRRERERE